MGYTPILTGLKAIPKQRKEVVEYFENTFRSAVTSGDINDLLTGNIHHKAIHNSIISSLQSTAEFAMSEYERTNDLELRDISNMIWNPLVAAMFQLKSDSQRETPPTPRSSSSASRPKTTTKAKIVTSTPVNLTDSEVTTIKRSLRAVVLTKEILYATPYHKHIKCEKSRCDFCRSMYDNVHLTKCENHKPCCKAGWYPHVGPVLWAKIRRLHDTGTTFVCKEAKLKANELPPIVGHTSTGNLVPTVQEEEEDPFSVVGCDVVSEPNSPSFHNMNWSDSVEDYISRTRKRRKSTSSVP